jgi:hypothetical protein
MKDLDNKKAYKIIKYMLNEDVFLQAVKWNPIVWNDIENHFPHLKYIEEPGNCLTWLKKTHPQYFI